MSQKHLEGKVAVVTGASRGIGRGIAERFAREGARVVVNFTADEPAADSVVAAIAAAGGEAVAVRADVSRSADVDDLVRATVERFGRLDILVNNAGIHVAKEFLETSEDEWDRTMAVNLKGPYLCAKAVAKEWELPLLKMEPGRLYDKFIGESEKNLERALQVAETLAPVVLWVDEIEKGFAAVTQSESDAGLSKRIFGRLLAWLQDRPAPVFVAATCNDILSLPPEMMRKGRFDEIFFVDLPNPEERAQIFAIHLRKRKRDPAAFNLAHLADASNGCSGAEIEQAIVSALYAAFVAGTELETDHVLNELKATRPLSVIRAEEVASLREWAASRTVPAS